MFLKQNIHKKIIVINHTAPREVLTVKMIIKNILPINGLIIDMFYSSYKANFINNTLRNF